MLKPTVRYRAQLPIRRSYKPARATLRVRVRLAQPRLLPPVIPNPACAPEGAWSAPSG